MDKNGPKTFLNVQITEFLYSLPPKKIKCEIRHLLKIEGIHNLQYRGN